MNNVEYESPKIQVISIEPSEKLMTQQAPGGIGGTVVPSEPF